MNSSTEEKKWYEGWFESKYYDILYRKRDSDEAQQFLSALVKKFALPAQSKILDAGCGRGRHCVLLAKMNFDVIGIDIAAKRIHYAQKFESDTLSFFIHDMRQIFYANYFDALLNLFTSFGYFDSLRDNARAIHSMSASLKKDGWLVIDFFNTEKIMKQIPVYETMVLQNIEFEIEKRMEANTIIKTIRFQDGSKDFVYEERVQALTLDDFTRLFAAGGIRIEEVFGDYNLSSYNESASDRMIIVGRKN